MGFAGDLVCAMSANENLSVYYTYDVLNRVKTVSLVKCQIIDI